MSEEETLAGAAGRVPRADRAPPGTASRCSRSRSGDAPRADAGPGNAPRPRYRPGGK